MFAFTKMKERIRIDILDFSGMFSRERALIPEPDRFDFRIVDFTGLEETMCFCGPESAAVIRQRIAEMERGAVGPGRLHWIDTGDYHYLTYFFLERLTRPFTLVLFDNHPDDQPSVFGPDMLSCGGWVRTAMETLPNLRCVVRVGVTEKIPGTSPGMTESGAGNDVEVAGDDGEGAGNDGKGAGNDGKTPDQVGGDEKRVGNGRSVIDVDGERLKDVVAGLAERGESVYLSIDKDVLEWADARTDWSQGVMRLNELLSLLDLFKGTDLAGVDICGGRTEAKGATEEDFAVNARTDAVLMGRFPGQARE